ncbi:DUF6083 domain-containing protein [Streptomyces coelicoflavus]|uniref:DUF6083 domain-containing protein n=1 Tax=Streptomyces coelicoflavus TaxID=285562 RepID=UPI0036B66D3B
MGRWEKEPRRLSGGQSRCPDCGLWQDRAPTLEQEWVLLETDMRALAHTVPAEHRWIELSDGRVTAALSTASPAPHNLCRISGRG